jgi:hypothetical protein
MLVQVDPAGVGEVPDRKRAWGVRFFGDTVIARHYIVDLAPEEDIRDFPETHELTRDEWAQMHAEYGLTLDGSPA